MGDTKGASTSVPSSWASAPYGSLWGWGETSSGHNNLVTAIQAGASGGSWPSASGCAAGSFAGGSVGSSVGYGGPSGSFTCMGSASPASESSTMGRMMGTPRGGTNEGEWTFTVCAACVELAPEPSAGTLEVLVNDKIEHVNVRVADVITILEPYASCRIVAFREWREKFWKLQLGHFLLFHSFVVLEIEDGVFICTEKYNDKLGLMLGEGELIHAFMAQYRVFGETRYATAPQEYTELRTCITVHDFQVWICGPLARVWQPYRLLSANCQHYAHDLKQFLLDPSKVEELRRDREVVLPAVKRCGLHLQFAAQDLRNDREVVVAAVAENALALRYASEKLRSEWDIVRMAVEKNGMMLEFAGQELKGDPGIVTTAVRKNGMALEFAAEDLRRDLGVVLAAVRRSGPALRFASDGPRRNRMIVLAAVRENGMALQFACEDLSKDREVVLTALARNSMALQFAGEDLRRDREVVLSSVSIDGLSLQYASQELTRDHKLVFAAVRNHGLALEFASPELKRDRAFVLAAVRWDGLALQFAAEELKGDREIVLAAKM